MNITNLLTFSCITAVLVFAGCKGKPSKELIVNKWKYTAISGSDAAGIPDSVKKNLFENASMTFNADGTYEQTTGYIDDGSVQGTYSLSGNGKIIYTKENNSNGADTVMIVEISKNKMIVTPLLKGRAANFQVTMVPK
jgi:hypothetical protein